METSFSCDAVRLQRQDSPHLYLTRLSFAPLAFLPPAISPPHVSRILFRQLRSFTSASSHICHLDENARSCRLLLLCNGCKVKSIAAPPPLPSPNNRNAHLIEISGENPVESIPFHRIICFLQLVGPLGLLYCVQRSVQFRSES